MKGKENEMKQQVQVKIIGTQKDSQGEENVIELVTEGTFVKKNGKYYVIYEESELSGMEGSTTTLKIDGEDRVNIRRFGSAKADMIFEKGKTHSTGYETPYGLMEMNITTHRISVSVKEEIPEIFVKIQYRIKVMGSEDTMNILEISIA
jgi:uncharacterized beta-barrel protein YwiB (DUF1934 family)